MPKIVPKDRALIFFSQLPIPSLEPNKVFSRITGSKEDSVKVERALILDMLTYFKPVKKEYDYYYFYAPLKRGQKINFTQLKDSYKLSFKKAVPQEKYEQPVSMLYAILKLLKLKYREIVLVNPISALLEYTHVRDIFGLMSDYDAALWRQKGGGIGVIGIRNSDHLIGKLESMLPCTSSKLFHELKSDPQLTLRELSPPISSLDSLFNHSPIQIKQYYPELSQFGKLVS
jgi:hypothetical protein